YFVFSLAVPDVQGLVASLSTFVLVATLLGAFFFQWMYWTICEVFLNGQTPGKRLLRIRVVRDDGGAVSFFESAVRNLLRIVDFMPAFYAAGILCMLLTKEHRRIG